MGNASSRKRWWDFNPPFWLGLVLSAVLILVLIAAPIAASRFVHLWAGVGLAALALPAWVYLGPRPMPGFLSGLLAVNSLFPLLAMLIIAIVRALHGAAVAG